MGIKNLMKIINDKAPDSVKSKQLKSLNGYTLACDASLSIYQNLVSTISARHAGVHELKDDEGNLTGHLIGLFNRTLMLLENGIRPVWVFDGKPPDLKSLELDKRKQSKEFAEEQKKEALEEGNAELAKKMAGRSVRITKKMIEDAKTMLIYMGCPIVEAPCEAEAQCSELVKAGKAFATCTEDMDALTFGSKNLIRNVNSKGEPIIQINLKEMLDAFEMTMEEFIDLCILCGCDYTQSIKGIGPSTAFKMMKNHGSIEKILETIKTDSKLRKKHHIPDPFLYEEARELFKNHDVRKAEEIKFKWQPVNEKALFEFLVHEKKFLDKRVEEGIKKIKRHKDKPNQTRLDGFFKKPTAPKPEAKKVSPKEKVQKKGIS
ncbi:unnamed protein product [Moneuplotes crassus]|uniref:Flap endonuclease 1 n=1 Tax=Euplotes crassus TaxID=5936 RepID=A0AAD1XBW9_EUPCR|nr:unnamed protein product [Moneuplotes crassus]